jgi:hypothetical protein
LILAARPCARVLLRGTARGARAPAFEGDKQRDAGDDAAENRAGEVGRTRVNDGCCDDEGQNCSIARPGAGTKGALSIVGGWLWKSFVQPSQEAADDRTTLPPVM